MNNYNVANTTNSNLVVFKKKIKMYNHFFILMANYFFLHLSIMQL